jgi:serine phosphatase RsbU (regulator of sigma subunit)/integral membrane sensor domain MASE1
MTSRVAESQTQVGARGSTKARALSFLPGEIGRKPILSDGWARYLVGLVALAAVYFGAAKLGLTMAFVAEQVTVVWPPAGIALAALLLGGYRMWPGVMFGAFLANATANEPLGTAAGIALGNTLEALAGAWMLRRLSKFDRALGCVKDVMGLVILAAGLSTMVGATIGVTSLCVGGVTSWRDFPAVWSVWWLGDAMGVLVVAPLVLTWGGWRRIRWHRWLVIEVSALLLASVIVSFVAFVERPAILSSASLAYSIFPLLIWAAIRFGGSGAALAIFVASTIAIWGTLHGLGAFTAPTTHQRLMLLQIFMSAAVLSTSVLAAVTTEREGATERLAAEQRVALALAESTNLEKAAPKLLGIVCEALGWHVGVFWIADRQARVLRCIDVWHAPAVEVPEFERASRQLTLASGDGLAGRVWARDSSVWVHDLAGEAKYPRAAVAASEGLHAACGFPVRRGMEFLGAMEFFSRDIQEPDVKTIAMMTCITHQISQFLERDLAEKTVRSRERELALARELQQCLLPKSVPAAPGFAFAGGSRFCQETGGDFYDFFPLAHSALGIAIGDASGHGIGAALVMAELRAALHALALTHGEPHTIMTVINRFLAEDLPPDRFVTLLLARLESGPPSLVYCNAGHGGCYVMDERGDVRSMLDSTSIPLGIDLDAEFPDAPRIMLSPGDLLCLLTDGVLEAYSPAGLPFGSDRAMSAVRAHRYERPEEIVQSLLNAVAEFSDCNAQLDDITAVIIKVDTVALEQLGSGRSGRPAALAVLAV